MRDQLVAFDLADIFKKADGKPLTSGGQEFTEVCDLILQLHRPRIYHRERAGAYREYVAEDDGCSILDVRYNAGYNSFKDLHLENFEIQYGLDNKIWQINGIDAVFKEV